MYENVYLPVTSLPQAPVKTGGLCSIKYFRWQDVLEWPAINPQTGMMDTSLQMKPGTFIYLCSAIDQDKTFDEEVKNATPGDMVDINVKGTLTGASAANILSLQTMKYNKWGVIADDKNGVTRLIGNEDSGADLFYNYTSNDNGGSRKINLKWNWQHSNPAPIYTAEAFNITIGGVPITAGALQLIMRFRVGYQDAFANPPIMVDGDIDLVRAAFINKQLLILADGLGLPIDDDSGDIDWTGSIIRHVHKNLLSDTMSFIGGVVHGETIQIYAWS